MKAYKQFMAESMSSKLVQTKLGTMDTMKTVEIPSHEERRAKMEKRKKEEEAKKGLKEDSLDEAKSNYTLYHPSYSAAVQHAKDHLNKKGLDISDDDWFKHVNSGPSKPSEGKTNSLHIPLTKDGKETKKRAHIQVYNRGNDVKNAYELNMYNESEDIADYTLEELEEFTLSEEFEALDELSKTTLKSYIKKSSNSAIGDAYNARANSHSADGKEEISITTKQRNDMLALNAQQTNYK